MATLSLYLFNLLPLPFLDGTQLLDEALDFVFASSPTSSSLDEVDLEALESGMSLGRGGRYVGGEGQGRGRGRGRWKYWLGRVIRFCTTGLVVGYVGLGAIDWFFAG